MSELVKKRVTWVGVLTGCFFASIIILTGVFAQNKSAEESVGEGNGENKIILTCDGDKITKNCELNGIEYLIYKYYPAVEAVYRTETIKTYKKEIVGYCTLCRNGKYSPTCATGRGACSHHGGVAQWNAPVYRDVPHYEEQKVLVSPAIPERYEKIIKN